MAAACNGEGNGPLNSEESIDRMDTANPIKNAARPGHSTTERTKRSPCVGFSACPGCKKKSTQTIANQGPIQYEISNRKFSYLPDRPFTPYKASAPPSIPVAITEIQRLIGTSNVSSESAPV